MINLAQFSGGKDSTAMLLWMKEQGIEYTAVFCDTGWEHPLTYAYIEEINQTVLGGRLVILRNQDWDGFRGLVLSKAVFPRRTMRFCTEKLKLEPLWRYILSVDDDVETFIGERAEESAARAAKPIRQWSDEAGGYWMNRPIHGWTSEDVFEIHRRHNVKPNPLYLMGAGRVGCWPCAFISKRELKALLRSTPELKERLRELEAQMRTVIDARQAVGEIEFGGASFFSVGYIPARFCSLVVRTKTGMAQIPTCDDVFRYLESVDENQLPLFEAPKCMSIYNLCE